jgi:hypothetical protein
VRAIAWCLLAAAAVALVGCGGDGSNKDSAPRVQANAPSQKPVQRILTRKELARVPGAADPLASGSQALRAAGGVPNTCHGQWTAPSPLVLIQGFYKYWITLYLTQEGQRIWGKAGYKIGSRLYAGTFGGYIKGNSFSVRIFWSITGRAAVGVYNGEINPWSFIFQGRTYDQANPSTKAEEFSSSKDTLFYCAPSAEYPEVVRQAIPEEQYQADFDRFTKAGYRPVWIDVFRAAGKNWFNVIYRTGGPPWIARHNLTGGHYQVEFDLAKGAGYRPLHIESYPTPAGIRYAAIFVKDSGPPLLAYHGLSGADHQAAFNRRTAEGWVPVIISVAPWNGARWYTALYEKKDAGSFAALQVVDVADYQSEYGRQAAAGRKLVYLNAYNDAGGVRFTTIWHTNANWPFARHSLTTEQYQAALNEARARGELTRAVTGYEERPGAVYYAGFWLK